MKYTYSYYGKYGKNIHKIVIVNYFTASVRFVLKILKNKNKGISFTENNLINIIYITYYIVFEKHHIIHI